MWSSPKIFWINPKPVPYSEVKTSEHDTLRDEKEEGRKREESVVGWRGRWLEGKVSNKTKACQLKGKVCVCVCVCGICLADVCVGTYLTGVRKAFLLRSIGFFFPPGMSSSTHNTPLIQPKTYFRFPHSKRKLNVLVWNIARCLLLPNKECREGKER